MDIEDLNEKLIINNSLITNLIREIRNYRKAIIAIFIIFLGFFIYLLFMTYYIIANNVLNNIVSKL